LKLIFDRNILRFNKLSALSLTALIALTGCSAEPQAIDQDSIVLYAGRDEELVQPLIEKFEEETGITVEVRYASSAELAAQLLEEGDNSPADIFFAQDAGALGAVSKAGLLTKLPQEIYDLVPSAYSAADGMWVGVSGRVRVMNYNPNTVTELPKSVFDLADPIWKGRIAIAPSNASFQAFVTAMRVVEGDDKTLEWLTGMKQNAVIFEKNGAILEAVEAGQVDLGLINHYYWYALAQEQGVENMKSKIAQFETNDVGNLINAAGIGIVNDSTAARKFVEYLLSETGQTYFAESTREYPLIAGVTPADDLTPLKDIPAPKVDLSDLDSLERTLELIRQAGLI
jgi:iron(III) transport system substrate-binding protein